MGTHLDSGMMGVLNNPTVNNKDEDDSDEEEDEDDEEVEDQSN